MIGTALVGGLAAIAFAAVFDPDEVTVDLDLFVFALGAALALGVHQAATWRRQR